ncbi:hypothetical protein BDP27DRAFT_727307 [Rhodocollybia butyracea]|uniref:Uncharacterized protein n=1 Tax=Rhodocollybia butyracea TaxID=206335 RepID=A0A9P5P598_9AGAR|nr:hypothetical protein BDP27DRAFT_727307 [Rhodocollybia butyracea]
MPYLLRNFFTSSFLISASSITISVGFRYFLSTIGSKFPSPPSRSLNKSSDYNSTYNFPDLKVGIPNLEILLPDIANR